MRKCENSKMRKWGIPLWRKRTGREEMRKFENAKIRKWWEA